MQLNLRTGSYCGDVVVDIVSEQHIWGILGREWSVAQSDAKKIESSRVDLDQGRVLVERAADKVEDGRILRWLVISGDN